MKKLNHQKSRKILLMLLVGFGCGGPLNAQDANITGLNLLQSLTTNVNGTGIRVAQPEASLSTNSPIWEVNPASAGQPVSLFTYYSSDGSTNIFPNSLSAESSHADSVAQAFYGMPGGMATNVAHVDNYDADFFITNYVFNLTPMPAASVVNQSFTFGALSVGDQQAVDSAYDDYADIFGTLFISPADNGGNVHAPGTSYNCICVAAYGGSSSIGPTLDNGRAKPDITAPAGATSFSTPQVSGAAADLMQAGLRGDGGGDTNSATDIRTVKALLMNGAVKPADWTHVAPSPLDTRYGVGVLNIYNSYELLVGGKHGFVTSTTTASLGGSHLPAGGTGTIGVLNGWDFNTNSSGLSSDTVNHYYFNVTNGQAGAQFTATATLVWNRQQSQTNINHLDLFLYDCANSNLVMCSTSLVDNVEHIFVPQLAPGRYDLQVWKAGGIPVLNVVSAAEPYALAFAFNAPTISLAGQGNYVLASWPAYPAGFGVQVATDLTLPDWSTNNLPVAGLTNSMNTVLLPATNAMLFFRLRSPNF